MKYEAGLPVQVVEVVVTRLERVGDGNPGNPIRRITQVWTPDGELIAELDPIPTETTNGVLRSGRGQ